MTHAGIFSAAVLVLGLMLPLHAIGAEEYLNMPEAVKVGLERNQDIEAAQFRIEEAEAGRKSALGDFGPAMNLFYSYTRLDEAQIGFDEDTFQRVESSKNQWTMNLNLSQPLFTGFRLLNSYERSKLVLDVAQQQLRQARINLISLIQTNFLELLQARETVKSAQASVERLEAQLQVSQAFYDVGLRPKLDVLQAEVDVAQARLELLAAQNAVRVQRARLNSLLYLPVEADIQYMGELEYVPLALSFEESLAVALKRRPEYLVALKSVAIAKRDREIVASAFYPRVDGNFDYFRYGDDPSVSGSELQEEDEWRLSAELQWNVFDSFSDYYSYQQSKRVIDRLEAEFRSLEEEITFEVKANYLNVEEAAERIQVARKGLAEAREGYRMAQARYKAQVGTYTDVLDAQARLSRSETSLIEALADYQQVLAQLYASMGVENIDLGES